MPGAWGLRERRGRPGKKLGAHVPGRPCGGKEGAPARLSEGAARGGESPAEPRGFCLGWAQVGGILTRGGPWCVAAFPGVPSSCWGQIGMQGAWGAVGVPVLETCEQRPIPALRAAAPARVLGDPGCGGVNLEQEGVRAIRAEGTWGQSHQDEKLPAAHEQ